MISANFTSYNNYVTDSLYQWDLNQDLVIHGLNLTVAPEIHFANANMDRAIVRQSTLEDGVVTVRIPNSLLQTSLPIKAYVGIYEGETFNVIEVVSIPVRARARPFDYTIEDTNGEVYSFKALENRINKILATGGNVVSVNGQLPDENGNITISAGTGSNYVEPTVE